MRIQREKEEGSRHRDDEHAREQGEQAQSSAHGAFEEASPHGRQQREVKEREATKAT